MFNFDEANRKGKEALDAALYNYSDVTKKFQAIATETSDYSKKSVQELTSFWESLLAARSIEAVYEIQTRYAKSSYESFIAEATKLSELYTDLAKTAYKPYEAPIAKASALVATNAA